MTIAKILNRAASILLLTMAATNSPAALAQEESAGASQAKANETPSEKPSAEKKPARKKPASPVNNDSPFDYEASEEISQDLSVSFPVDI